MGTLVFEKRICRPDRSNLSRLTYTKVFPDTLVQLQSLSGSGLIDFRQDQVEVLTTRAAHITD